LNSAAISIKIGFKALQGGHQEALKTAKTGTLFDLSNT
jgi:hypothetical protein